MRRIQWLLVAVVVLSFLAGCKKDVDQSLVVRNIAEQYYGYLIQGQFDAYVDGLYQPDSIPDSYRSQLIDNAKMFMKQQQQQHQGLTAVEAVSAAVDTEQEVADVYLRLSFGNGETEQVLVPMVLHQGVWYMR